MRLGRGGMLGEPTHGQLLRACGRRRFLLSLVVAETARSAYPRRGDCLSCLAMRLLLVRHADAVPGEPDAMRVLSPEGREAARQLGRRLADEGVRPSAILTSPLLRAR